jgi:hypothetical protein
MTRKKHDFRRSTSCQLSSPLTVITVNAALNFVDEVFSSRNLRRKTRNVRGARESSEQALHSEIVRIMMGKRQNFDKKTVKAILFFFCSSYQISLARGIMFGVSVALCPTMYL